MPAQTGRSARLSFRLRKKRRSIAGSIQPGGGWPTQLNAKYAPTRVQPNMPQSSSHLTRSVCAVVIALHLEQLPSTEQVYLTNGAATNSNLGTSAERFPPRLQLVSPQPRPQKIENAEAMRPPRRSPLIRNTSYRALILERNSPFERVFPSLSISNSMASTGESGFSTLRNTQIRAKSSFGMSNSSLRVPER